MSGCAAPSPWPASSAIPAASSRPSSWRANCAPARRSCWCTAPTIRSCPLSRWRMRKPPSKPPVFRSKPWRARGSNTGSIPRGCSAEAHSSTRCSALGPLELRIFGYLGQKRLQDFRHLVGIPFGRALDPADHLAAAVDNQGRRQAAHRKGVPDCAFRVEIGFDLVEAELRDERLDDVLAAAVLGNRRHGELVLAAPLQLFEGRHFLEAGLAPRRPEVEQDQLALEIGESHPIAREILEGNLGCWLRRRGRDKLAGFEVWLGRKGGPNCEQERDRDRAERGQKTARPARVRSRRA